MVWNSTRWYGCNMTSSRGRQAAGYRSLLSPRRLSLPNWHNLRHPLWAEPAADWLRYGCCLCRQEHNRVQDGVNTAFGYRGTWSEVIPKSVSSDVKTHSDQRDDGRAGRGGGAVIVSPQFQYFVSAGQREQKATRQETKSPHSGLYCKTNCALKWQCYLCLRVSTSLNSERHVNELQ